MGTEHLRHQFHQLFDNISEGDIKGFVFQLNSEITNSLVQLSIFLIDLFVGTYRLSSHARLDDFVIQTKLNLSVDCKYKPFGVFNISFLSMREGSDGSSNALRRWMETGLRKSEFGTTGSSKLDKKP